MTARPNEAPGLVVALDADEAAELRLMLDAMPASAQGLMVERPDPTALHRLALHRILELPIGTKGLAPRDRAARLQNAVDDMRRIAREALYPRQGRRAP
jgi:hypothetical protein